MLIMSMTRIGPERLDIELLLIFHISKITEQPNELVQLAIEKKSATEI